MSPFDVSVSYGLKEHCWHEEAGSVDLAAVAEEQKRMSKILAKHPKKNQLNCDKSGLFGLYMNKYLLLDLADVLT
jgi:hypothetical protein